MIMNEIQPKPSAKFFLRNIPIILKLKTSKRKKIERFINTTKRLPNPMYPKSEGSKGPMEEGMIYAIFNSEGKGGSETFDTVFKFFWVDAPSLRYSCIDSFLISEKLPSKLWAKSTGGTFVGFEVQFH